MNDIYKKHYEETCADLFFFYTELIRAGFTKDQAFDVVCVAVHNTTLDNLMRERTRRTKSEVLARARELNNIRKERQNDTP